MQTIEELSKHSLLEQIASCRTSAAIGSGDKRLASIRGFDAFFKQLKRTPAIVRMLLHKEYQFHGQIDASVVTDNENEILQCEWYPSTFVVPNYSRMVDWGAKMVTEADKGKIVVAIIPARTNTKWFHENVLSKATEMRFIKGRLQFPGFLKQSPFPDVIAIFDPRKRRLSDLNTRPLDPAVGMDMTNRKPVGVAIVASITGSNASISRVVDIDPSDDEEETRELHDIDSVIDLDACHDDLLMDLNLDDVLEIGANSDKYLLEEPKKKTKVVDKSSAVESPVEETETGKAKEEEETEEEEEEEVVLPRRSKRKKKWNMSNSSPPKIRSSNGAMNNPTIKETFGAESTLELRSGAQESVYYSSRRKHPRGDKKKVIQVQEFASSGRTTTKAE